YRADLLYPKERGFGAALSVMGYRIAMWVSSGLALIIADHGNWQVAYCVMAALLFIGVITTLFSPEPTWQAKPPVSLKEAVIEPFKEFITRSHAITILIFIILYKLGDAFAGSLTMTFLLRGLEFSLTEVGLIYKLLVIFATIIGGLLSGALMIRYGLYRCLLWFGILQAVTNFGFMVLAWVGKSYLGMIIVIALENFAGGMGTIAFVALLMALCNHHYTATQFALLSSLAAIGRVFVGPPSGYLVDALGWVIFFFITFLVALPGLFLLLGLKNRIENYDQNNA
ncbi:MAG: MFS transporter, partial [Gammaproteobacteria bacterium]